MCSIKLQSTPVEVSESAYISELLTDNCFGENTNDKLARIAINKTGFVPPAIISKPRFGQNKTILIKILNTDGIQDVVTFKDQSKVPGLKTIADKKVSLMHLKTLNNGSEIYLLAFGEHKEFYTFFTIEKILERNFTEVFLFGIRNLLSQYSNLRLVNLSMRSLRRVHAEH